MNISKALKVKNRLTGELSKLQEIWQRENSRRDDNPSKIEVSTIYIQYKETFNKLVAIKAAITVASVGIATELAELAELKNRINFINSLPCREGEEIQFVGRDNEKIVRTWKAYYNQADKDRETSKLQATINDLQDQIDAYNATTQIIGDF